MTEQDGVGPKKVFTVNPKPPSPEMSGEEMKAIRKRLGLSTIQLGRAFGYTGSDNTVSVTIRKYESELRPIPPWLARLMTMFDQHGVPERFLATFPIEGEVKWATVRSTVRPRSR